MNIPLLIETLRFLRPAQVLYRLKRNLHQPKLELKAAPNVTRCCKIKETIAKPQCLDGNGQFTFLNLTSTFQDWNQMEHGSLWTYNLNYMDWLEQEGMTAEDGTKWIDLFIHDLPANRTGQDPYPTALRIINWMKFFAKHPDCLNALRLNSLYSQVVLLSKKLEYHVLGNHLLEDAYALYISAVFFNEENLYEKSFKLLQSQLKEQILPDGAHYEQSPMYHCILLDRLLDCINFSQNNHLFSQQEINTEQLRDYAKKMLGHLSSIIYRDGSLPLLNDSANKIAPTPKQLFDYARRLDIRWNATPLYDCGYRKFLQKDLEVIMDIGNIMASYQPGHSHADTFNYELRVHEKPVIIDTGISTYNKNERRQYERGTAAHNTVTVEQKNSSRVWGGFRMGRRAKVNVIKDESSVIIACHNGFGHDAIHQRQFSQSPGAFCIEDQIVGKETEAISYLHLAPGLTATILSETEGIVTIGDIRLEIEGHSRIEVQKEYISTEYNSLRESEMLLLHFNRQLKYQIKVG